MIQRLALPLAICAALSVTAGAACGQSGDWATRVAEAAQLAETAQGLTRRSEALTALIVLQEAGQADLRHQMATLRAAETAARNRLIDTEADLASLLVALQRSKPGAAPLPLVHPEGSQAAARAAILTESLLGALDTERRRLAQTLAEVETTRQSFQTVAAELDVLRDQTSAARQRLIAAASAQAPLPPAYDSEAAAAWALTIEARTVDDLLQNVRSEGPASGGSEPKALTLPVEARPTLDGDGWRLQARFGALVRAPAAATVLYSGPLRGFRIVQILELSPGQQLILAGLGQGLVRSGDTVPAGTALGVLPDPPLPDLHGNVTNSTLPAGSLPRDTLYMEGRYADRPVDLTQWFAVTKDE